MCGLAEILHNWGFSDISGSDRADSDAIRRLADMGIKVSVGHSAENVKNAALVVYSAAIPEDNIERKTAREAGVPCIENNKSTQIKKRTVFTVRFVFCF